MGMIRNICRSSFDACVNVRGGPWSLERCKVNFCAPHSILASLRANMIGLRWPEPPLISSGIMPRLVADGMQAGRYCRITPRHSAAPGAERRRCAGAGAKGFAQQTCLAQQRRRISRRKENNSALKLISLFRCSNCSTPFTFSLVRCSIFSLVRCWSLIRGSVH